jgi:hypothetical protein
MTFPINEKRGLWDNIHAKRKRIKAGSGERMREPGSEGAPTAKALKQSQTEDNLFDLVYDFLISEDLDEQDVLDIMARVPIEEILEVIELDEEYKDLTPEKEERVKGRVGELARDIQVSAAKVKELRKKPFAKHRPGIQKQAAEIIKNVKKKHQLVQNASDALIRTSVSREAKGRKKAEDIKQQLRDLGENP